MAFDRYRHPPLATAWKIVKTKAGITRIPLITNLTLTYRCNLRCRYCEVWKRPGSEMNTATILRLIDEIAAAGTERLSLGGGEPMLRPDLGEIIAHARKRRLTTNLLSNGLQVRRRIGELAGLDFLAISLDGAAAAHDHARGAGSYDSALDAIRAARAAGIEVWTTTVLTRFNLDQIPAVLEIARREGARASFLPVMNESLRARNFEDLAPDREALVAAMDLLLTEKSRRGTPLAASAALLRFYRDRWRRDLPARDRGAWQGGTLRCQAGRLFCSIAPDGRLYPCNYLHATDENASASSSDTGFAEALARLETPDCAGCWCDSFIDANLVFSLHPGALLNVIRLLAGPPETPPAKQ